MTERAEKIQKGNPDNWQAVVMLAAHKNNDSGQPLPAPLDSPDAEMIPVPAPLPLIVSIGKDRISLEKDLRSEAAKDRVLRSLKGIVQERYGGSDNVPTLHPKSDMKISDKKGLRALRKLKEIQERLNGNAVFRKEQEGDFAELKALAEERVGLQVAMQKSQLADFKDEVELRRRVLRRLGHLTAQNMLTVKGKAAAEVCA
jgi:ATP-dependent RNA helicase DOB1